MRRGLLELAFTLAQPMVRPRPQGFMPLWFGGKAWPDVQCLVDPHSPVNRLYSYNLEPHRVLVGSPAAWAWCGAYNISVAFTSEEHVDGSRSLEETCRRLYRGVRDDE